MNHDYDQFLNAKLSQHQGSDSRDCVFCKKGRGDLICWDSLTKNQQNSVDHQMTDEDLICEDCLLGADLFLNEENTIVNKLMD